MANVFEGVCIADYCPSPKEDATFVLKRGELYTIGPVGEDGTCRVFTRYWVRVPALIFAGVQPLWGHSDPWEPGK